MKKILLLLLFLLLKNAFAQDFKNIALPEPNKTGGKPLMEALKDRKTQRNFSNKKLSLQQISDLLWAAFGINRPESGKRTAPSAVNWQEITIYVCLEEGVYFYDAEKNELVAVVQGDFRKNMGLQNFTAEAAIVLAFVADYSKMGPFTSKEDKDFYAAVDTGFISQNVYLFCASENLATVVLGAIDREKIKKTLQLKESQKVILTQCVGFPK